MKIIICNILLANGKYTGYTDEKRLLFPNEYISATTRAEDMAAGIRLNLTLSDTILMNTNFLTGFEKIVRRPHKHMLSLPIWALCELANHIGKETRRFGLVPALIIGGFTLIVCKDALPPEMPIRAHVMQSTGSLLLKTGLLGAMPEEWWRYLIQKFILKVPMMIEYIFRKGGRFVLMKNRGVI